jgi:hypothetical protein
MGEMANFEPGQTEAIRPEKLANVVDLKQSERA